MVIWFGMCAGADTGCLSRGKSMLNDDPVFLQKTVVKSVEIRVWVGPAHNADKQVARTHRHNVTRRLRKHKLDGSEQ